MDSLEVFIPTKIKDINTLSLCVDSLHKIGKFKIIIAAKNNPHIDNTHYIDESSVYNGLNLSSIKDTLQKIAIHSHIDMGGGRMQGWLVSAAILKNGILLACKKVALSNMG